MFMTTTTEDNMPNTYRFNQRVEKAKGLGLSGINRELKHYANIFKGGIPKSVKNRVQHLVQAKAELEALQHKKKVAKSLCIPCSYKNFWIWNIFCVQIIINIELIGLFKGKKKFNKIAMNDAKIKP